MSFLSKLFGSDTDLPPLEAGCAAAAQIEKKRASLEELAHKVHGKLQIVPGRRAVFVFIGRPPEEFGVVWFEDDGQEHNFKTMMKSRGFDQKQMAIVSEHLRKAYVKHQDEPRYSTSIAGKQAIVIPSLSFEQDIAAVIHEAD